jgi:uncharacterized protein (DUF1810 family)
MEDPYALQRFVDAQDNGGTYRRALSELRHGSKRGHWMWFVFPQISGLGRSEMSRHFAISGRDEAISYLAHPVLGPRLRECAQALVELGESDAVKVLGQVDAQKLHSSLTLFALAAPQEHVFQQLLDQYFAGRTDEGTISRL